MKIFFLLLFLVFAAASAGAATLTWKDNSGSMPGCSGSGPCDAEDGFAIQKLPAGDATFTEIDRVGANVTTYLDKAAEAGDCYRVAAFNAAGVSGFTNVACLPLRPKDPSDLKLSMEFSGTFRNDRVLAASPEGYQLAAVIKKRRFTGTLGDKR
ncbi:MAG TPA: hypothetical protein VGH16_16360 [Candidatus Binatia bacterium]